MSNPKVQAGQNFAPFVEQFLTSSSKYLSLGDDTVTPSIRSVLFCSVMETEIRIRIIFCELSRENCR